MLKKRIIPTLLLDNKQLVKTIKFSNPKYVGDPLNAIKIEVFDGIVWSNVPRKIPKRLFLSFMKNYHVGDINFFWKDISEKAVIRTKNFFNKNSKKLKM